MDKFHMCLTTKNYINVRFNNSFYSFTCINSGGLQKNVKKH